MRANKKRGGIAILAVGRERGGVPGGVATGRNRPDKCSSSSRQKQGSDGGRRSSTPDKHFSIWMVPQ